jgi:hypothetical protein
MKHAKMRVNMEHYASPMVRPVTGRTISSCKNIMHDPATAEVWQTAFGKDFGGIAQGCNKTGQKGMNTMFVMAHDNIRHAPEPRNFSRMQIRSWIIDRRKMIPTASESRREAI